MITKDKLLHFGAGFIVASIMLVLVNPLAGFVAALAAGIGKELYDMRFGGTVDRYDTVATVAGFLPALFFI